MNFVFITLDTQRGDRLGCQGYWREDISPNIDRIAAEGVRFKDFWASGMPTGPGFSCIHSGLNCITHRFYLTPWDRPNRLNFDDSIPVLSEYFLDNGYKTAAVDNLINFAGHMKQYTRGYNFYMNPCSNSGITHARTTADEVNALALPWIRQHAAEKDKPFFMWIHYWDPHTPYNHPTEWRNHYRHKAGSAEGLHTVKTKAGYDYVPGWGAADRIEEGDGYAGVRDGELGHDLYDEEVRYMDNAVGEVYRALEEAGALDDTCICVTSDHGEELGQHRDAYWGHKYLYAPNCYLPLILRYPPRLPQGKVVEGLAQHVDIVPTLLDLAGIDDIEPGGHGQDARLGGEDAGRLYKRDFDGHSLLPMIESGAPGRPFTFTEGGNNWVYFRSVMKDGWRLIWHAAEEGVYELYNFADDPAELYDQVDKEPAKRDELIALLDETVAQALDGAWDPIPRAGAPFSWPLQYYLQTSLGLDRLPGPPPKIG